VRHRRHVYVRKQFIAESGLSTADDGPERVRRRQKMRECDRSISEVAEDRYRKRQKMSGDAGVQRKTAEDDGSGGSVQMLLEDVGRWRFDVLQSRFQQAGGGHAYHRNSRTSCETSGKELSSRRRNPLPEPRRNYRSRPPAPSDLQNGQNVTASSTTVVASMSQTLPTSAAG